MPCENGLQIPLLSGRNSLNKYKFKGMTMSRTIKAAARLPSVLLGLEGVFVTNAPARPVLFEMPPSVSLWAGKRSILPRVAARICTA